MNIIFGIGIIMLDIEESDSSEILFPAKEKNMIDIETINKITQVYEDFKNFLKRIKADLTSREIRKEKCDNIFDAEELIEKNHKITEQRIYAIKTTHSRKTLYEIGKK